MVAVVVPYYVRKNDRVVFPDDVSLKVLGITFMAAGLALFLYTVLLFRQQGRGTLAPWTPTQKLVVDGPYRYCRNPMISGVLFVLLGEFLLFNSWGILSWAVLFFLINSIYFLTFEEPSLEKRFGESYRRYKSQVPRWIPKFKPYKE